MQEKKRKFFFCDRMNEMKEQRKQLILAVSGVKNSGKTTLIASLLPKLKQKGLKAAVVKHDGHEFEADIPGTDTWRFGEAGACGTLVFSGTKYMMVKYQPAPETDELITCFPEADVVLLEGFKYSEYPKIEVIRKGNSARLVCDPKNLLGIVTDYTSEELEWKNTCGIPFFGLEETERLADYIMGQYISSQRG